MTPFWTERVVVRPYAFNEASPGNKLYGVYVSRASAPARPHFDVEPAAQFATVGASDIRAWMVTLNGVSARSTNSIPPIMRTSETWIT